MKHSLHISNIHIEKLVNQHITHETHTQTTYKTNIMCVMCMCLLYVLFIYVFSHVWYGGDQARPDIPPYDGRDSTPFFIWGLSTKNITYKHTHITNTYETLIIHQTYILKHLQKPITYETHMTTTYKTNMVFAVCICLLHVVFVYVFSYVWYGGNQTRPDIPPCNGKDSTPIVSGDYL